MCTVLFDDFNGFSLEKKEIGKEISYIYYWKKLTFSKLVGKINFSKENLKKCNSFEEQNGTKYIRRNVYFGIIFFSCLSSTKPCIRFFLICFAREIKGFYESSLGNEADFRDIMNVSPNILVKNKNFKKLRHGFVDEGALITTTLISSCHWKTFVSFCLAKEKTWKRIFNTNSELRQNRTEKQIMASKTTIHWLFNDVWCYIFIVCFDWKIFFFNKQL